MHFNCNPNNDLYRVLNESGTKYPRHDTLAEAIEAAPVGGAVLSLADTYPKQSVGLDKTLLDQAKAKSLKLYIEYPAALPGLSMGEPQRARWERLVVTSDLFRPELDEGRILGMHACWYLPVDATDPHLSLAKVAGYNHAVYGLPEQTFPILFELPNEPVLVATSKLSQFVTGRYAPTQAWKEVWERILTWLAPEAEAYSLRWTPTVQVMAGPDERMPPAAEATAFERSIKWFKEHGVYSIDEKKGAIEGFESLIDHNGRQMRRPWVRGDCVAETGMLFAYDWALHGDPSSKLLATQILDYVWSPDFYHSDLKSPAYGLTNWYERGPIFYGDDNARVLMPTLAAARLLGDDRWDELVLTGLLANLRTSGTLGFRRNNITMKDFDAHGGNWRFFRNEDFVVLAPHFECYLWACFLWGYALTGYEGFLDRTKTAIRTTMEAYPKWRWTNGLTQEMARMLLPLSFLVRLEDTPEHRGWLYRIGEDLLQHMQPSGAIQEQMGALEDGRYAAPRSNEAYGTREASLIQQNGDPACDLLYTTNFALLGLHEAAAVTGDALFQEAENRLADFLCRIQVRSEAQPYLDGAWLRSFDYSIWEYWGSSADLGWGPWCVESGWTNTWIASVLGMRQLGDSLFDVSRAERFRHILPSVLEKMEME